ncbi:Two-component system response regulator [Fulvivirga imtechensis AK7]|uniref:Two-component system response regulator n=1 Tax=Fulvivirga imtechensis AK7 TaxID=1237149 RepID=L8JPH2_9BACT|nr:LytTR family DNA-binding domain-containing protein [Fulvivirga imtechensis]ELR69247.1 Two-component system response regulator [Fulvivirga imtechensis AK7]
MDVLIIEDERPAATRLERLLKNHNNQINILNKIDSVKKAVQWLRLPGNQPQLIFMDIQLADGLSFEIFEHVDIEAPVIFTTAFDEYALKAFKVNSIDYLLKPVDEEELAGAFEKLERLALNHHPRINVMEQINEAMAMLTNKYKSRFVIKVGEHIKSIAVDDIQYFFSRDKASFCCTFDAKNHLLDYSLEQIEAMVDPGRFFRINRQYLISLNAINDIISYSNSRLKIILNHCSDQGVIVSRDRVNDFKNWLDR